jgi:hypothetical protein
MGNLLPSATAANKISHEVKQMRLPLIVLFLLLIPASAQIKSDVVSKHKQIDFNWTYTPNLPVCTSVLVACYSGFTMKDTGDGHELAGPSVIRPTARSWAYFPSGGVRYGSHTFALVANAYDENGQPVASAPVTVTINVATPAPSGPASLTAALQ